METASASGSTSRISLIEAWKRLPRSHQAMLAILFLYYVSATVVHLVAWATHKPPQCRPCRLGHVVSSGDFNLACGCGEGHKTGDRLLRYRRHRKLDLRIPRPQSGLVLRTLPLHRHLGARHRRRSHNYHCDLVVHHLYRLYAYRLADRDRRRDQGRSLWGRLFGPP